MTTLSKEDGRTVERKMKPVPFPTLSRVREEKQQPPLANCFSRKRKTAPHFTDNISLPLCWWRREAAELLELAQEQAEAAEDDLVRTSFHNAELQMLLTDEKLQAEAAEDDLVRTSFHNAELQMLLTDEKLELSQAHEDLEISLRRNTGTVQETLYALHKLFLKKKEDGSPFDRQAEAAEDDLVRTSFHNAELQMLLTDEKLQAEAAEDDLVRTSFHNAELQMLLTDEKLQAEAAEDDLVRTSFHNAELQMLLTDEKLENTKLIAQLQQSEVESLPDNTEQQDHSFLPECFLAHSASPMMIDEEEMLPADMEHKEDSFLPECFLAHCPSPMNDKEEGLPADMERKEDSFLPECFLARCPSPMNDKEEGLPADMEHKEDSFLPECFLARCPSPMNDKEEGLPADMERKEDSFLPECLLARCPSPMNDKEEGLPADMECKEDSFLPAECFLACCPSPMDDEVDRQTADTEQDLSPRVEIYIPIFIIYNRSAQKHILIDDLKARVTVLKTGGSCFSSRYEARAHVSLEEAEAIAYRIAELEVLLEEQRNENTKLTAQLQQSEEESLPDNTEQQDHSFLPECFLAHSASPIDEEEMLPADMEQKEDSFLPETTPIPDKELVIRLVMARRHVTAEALATATLPRQTKRRTVIFRQAEVAEDDLVRTSFHNAELQMLLTDEKLQAEVAEDDLVRTSFHNAELQMLLTDEKLQAEAAEDDLVRTSFHNAELQMLLTDEKLELSQAHEDLEILFLKKREDGSPFNSQAEAAEDDLVRTSFQQMLLTDEKLQAEAAEDDLVRTSFHNAELQMLLTDEKLELSQAHEDLEILHSNPIIYDRSAQKHILIDDLKAQVAILKTGGSCFSSRYEARAHVSLEEAEAMAYRIAELEVLLEEQRNENTELIAQLQQSEEESLPYNTEQQDHSFLPECFLAHSASPIDEEEMLPPDMECKEDSFLPECFLARCPSPMNDKEEGLPADMERKEDSFLPECFLARCPSPMNDKEEGLPADMEHKEDSFLPECFLVRCPSPMNDKEEGLPADMEHKEDSFLPECFLARCPSPMNDKEEGLPADMERKEDSFLPECFLVRCPSPMNDKEEGLPADMEHKEDSFLPECFLARCPSPMNDKEEGLPADMERKEDSFLPECFLARCPSPMNDKEEGLPADMERKEDSFLPECFLACCPSPMNDEEEGLPADTEQDLSPRVESSNRGRRGHDPGGKMATPPPAPPFFFVFQDYCHHSGRAWRSVQPPHLRLEGCSWSDALPLRQQGCAGHTTASYGTRHHQPRQMWGHVVENRYQRFRGGGFRAQRYEEQQFEDQARLAFRSPTPPSPPVHPTSPAAQGTDSCSLSYSQQSQGGEAATSFSHSLRRDTGTVQETLYALHKEAAELLELAQEQAEVAEDDLVRTSFHNAELQMLLTDEKLQAEAAEDDLVRTSFHNAELQMLLTDEKLSLRRDTYSTVQETLYALHKLFLEKKEDGSPFNREAAELVELAQEQAEAAEDDLVRTSFHNAELQMLLTDEKLQADDAKVQHERSAQKHLEIDCLKAQVSVLKSGGARFSSRHEARAHISLEEAEGMAYRIAELEVLLEEQRNENIKLTAQLQQSKEERLPAVTEQQDPSFLPECFLTHCPSPIDEEEMLPADMERKEDSFLPECFLAHSPSPMNDKDDMLPADMERKEDSFLPECFLACSASPMNDNEEGLPADMECKEDSFLPECFLACSASPMNDKDDMLPADMERKEDSFLPECFLACSASPMNDNEEGLPADMECKEDSFLPECFLACSASPMNDKDDMLPADMECKEDSFLPECFLARCPSPMDDEEEMLTYDMNMDIAPLLEELLINSSSLLQADSVAALDQESQDILCLSELLSSTSPASLTASCDGRQAKSQDTKMVKSQASVNKVTCSGLLRSMLQEAHEILCLSEKLSTLSAHHDKTEPIKVKNGQVVKTELPTEATYWTTVEPCQGSCCYTTTYISSNKDITVYQQL
uniref:Uncharacterized protein n=1 Tax=Branchiostoma floridae TaxID=7739 RepID=C3ZGI5_BRAFL|eukprot:XP_002592355.1 hypothetical protein BRAFLDRAFT_129628 [Branchiostoma floridae]